jgi:hypothetical protein
VGILFFKTPTSCFFGGSPMIPSRYPIGTLRVSQGEEKEKWWHFVAWHLQLFT